MAFELAPDDCDVLAWCSLQSSTVRLAAVVAPGTTPNLLSGVYVYVRGSRHRSSYASTALRFPQQASQLNLLDVAYKVEQFEMRNSSGSSTGLELL